MKFLRPTKPHQTIAITGGRFRGQRLAVPASGTHPMGARERLALFNMLDCADLNVLDLFAGSGALGFEALSRGARSVTFVDNSPAACHAIKENAQKLGVTDAVRIIKASINGLFEVAVRSLANVEEPPHKDGRGDETADKSPVTLALIDPPYSHPEFFTTTALSHYSTFVNHSATLVLSRPKTTQITPPDTLKLLKTRTYAGLALDFFEKV